MKVELTKSQCRNLADFIEWNFISSLRDDIDIDNINYLCDICDAYRKLREVEKSEEE